MGILEAFKLDGKVALVTGARQGLGQAMAVGLAEAGADVIGLDRDESEQTGQAIRSLGRKYHPVVCDLRQASAADLQAVMAEALTSMANGGMLRLDILLNNAGIIRRAPALDFSESDWDDVIQVNLRSVFFLSQAVARLMAPRRAGKIINIASMLSFQGAWPGSDAPWRTNGPNTESMSMPSLPVIWRPITPPHCGPTPGGRPRSWSASQPDAGAYPTISKGWWCSWLLRHPITCMEQLSRSMAAGSRAENSL